jgi:enoyl-CoA hydratase/carnithine racemase
MESSTVLCDRDGPVAIVRLNRPEKHNAVNRELAAALAETFERLEADDSVLVTIITGAGDKAFCAGADMSERSASLERSEASGEPPPPRARVDGIGAVARSVKPTIAAINGYAYGGGARLALAPTSALLRRPPSICRGRQLRIGGLRCHAAASVGPSRAKS